MTDWLLQVAFSNVCVAAAIAALAWTVQTLGKKPALAHPLWIVALLKLVTPPLIDVPIATSPRLPAADWVPADTVAGEAVAGVALGGIAAMGSSLDWRSVLVGLWLAGSACVLAWSLWRIVGFNRWLSSAAIPVDRALHEAAADIARQFGLRAPPRLLVTRAQISPLVWWLGGTPRIVIPAALLHSLKPQQLRWVLAHEIAHIRRGDHLVRWLEWLVCVCCWWNPLAWWASRNLRITEEVCCDALVVAHSTLPRRGYAESLVAVSELLVTPEGRPPAMASRINGGGLLERRIKMIASKKGGGTLSSRVRVAILVFAAGLLPLGITSAQLRQGDMELVRAWLESGVNSAQLTREQANLMLTAVERDMARRDPAFAAVPLPLVRIPPAYPPQALARGVEGWVDVDFTITTDGKVRDAVAVSSFPSGVFEESALKAIARWRYNPRVMDGQPVEQPAMRTRIDFVLSE